MSKLNSFVHYIRGRASRAQNHQKSTLIKGYSTLAAILLAVTLLMLVVIPMLINEWSSRLRDRELDLLAPFERAVDKVERSLLDMDNDHRGYLLSHNRESLLGFPAHLQELDVALEQAGQFAKSLGNTAPQLVIALRSRSQSWAREYALPIQESAQGGKPASEIKAKVEEGKTLLQSARTSVEEIRTFLAGRRAIAQSKIATFTRWSLLGSVVLGIAALLGSAYLFHVARRTANLYHQAFEAYQSALGKSTLLESQLSFTQALLRHTPLGIAVVDVNEAIVKFGNRAFEQLPFVKTAEALSRPLKDILTEGAASNSFMSTIKISREKPSQVQIAFEVEYQTAEEAASFWNLRVVPFGEKEPSPEQLLLIWEDITASKTSFQRIDRERQIAARLASELHVILDNMGDGVIVVNQNNEAVIVNTEARELLGIPKDLRLPQPIATIGKEPSQSLSIDLWKQTDNQALSKAGASRVSLYPTAKEHLIEIIATPIRNEASEIISVVGVLHDITEFKKSEREKDEFLALASHELKTPLTVLSTSCQLINKATKAHSWELIEAANPHILTQLRRLTLLIMQVFDFANLQADRMQLKVERSDLCEIVIQAIEEDKILSEEHTLTLDLPKKPAMTLVDPLRIEQVLNNFVSNAIRYSPKNSTIHVKLDLVGRLIRVCVTDEGIGIEKEDLMKIFKRFGRGSNVGNVAGLGVGLYLSSEIIRAHKGRIWAESGGINQGSSFYFELPSLESKATEKT